MIDFPAMRCGAARLLLACRSATKPAVHLARGGLVVMAVGLIAACSAEAPKEEADKSAPEISSDDTRGGGGTETGADGSGEPKRFEYRVEEPGGGSADSEAETAEESVAESGEDRAPRTRGVTSPDEASEEQEDWTLVPVFYGTDRQRSDKTDRIAYNWERARRLELGRAMVSIPKDHVEPQIERPWALRIPYTTITLYEAAENPKDHFTIQEIQALSPEQFRAFVSARMAKSSAYEDHALVFVHGYQTTFDNAVFRTAQIAYDIEFDGVPFLYSWPSGGTVQGYKYDENSAAQAEPYLRDFLKIALEDSGAKKVSVIAHSMGNQPLLRVLQEFRRAVPEGVVISQVIFAAPDVDRDSFRNIVSSIKGVAEGITLYAASNDAALALSRQVNGGVPRAGDVPENGPVVIEGVDTIDATAASTDTLGINHSGYAENVVLLADIEALIRTGVRPPKKRAPSLEEVDFADGVYWRFPANAGQPAQP